MYTSFEYDTKDTYANCIHSNIAYKIRGHDCKVIATLHYVYHATPYTNNVRLTCNAKRMCNKLLLYTECKPLSKATPVRLRSHQPKT